MKFEEILSRAPAVPWSEGGKIPWHEPGFSARMLREHLSQDHDRASRKAESIEHHVTWLHTSVMGGTPGRVLDLGCGPGLYCERFAELGHATLGIDISPASIEYARSSASESKLSCEFKLEDVRTANFGQNVDLVLLSFGELNAFPKTEAAAIVERARASLCDTGALVIEVHRKHYLRSIGMGGATWMTAQQSVFSDQPHLYLRECTWHVSSNAATERYFVLSPASDEIECYVSTAQAYTDDEFETLLRGAGFAHIERFGSLSGDVPGEGSDMFAFVARG